MYRKNCGNEVKEEQEVCLNCGNKNPDFKGNSKKRITKKTILSLAPWFIFMFIVFIIAIHSALSNSSSNTASSSVSSNELSSYLDYGGANISDKTHVKPVISKT